MEDCREADAQLGFRRRGQLEHAIAMAIAHFKLGEDGRQAVREKTRSTTSLGTLVSFCTCHIRS
eukprot:c22382_g1_i1 orf=629-820(+)